MQRPWLVGDKVYLRSLEESDIDDGWHDWINDPIATQGLFGANPQSREHMVNYYKAQLDLKSNVMLAICDRQTDRYIGNARLSSIDWIHRIAVYGRLIGPPEYRGGGYGSDALVQLLRHGFHNLGLNRIWSIAWGGNELSLGSNDKIGMVREGIARDYCFKNGQFYDGVYLSMLRREFDERHGDSRYWLERDDELRQSLHNRKTSSSGT